MPVRATMSQSQFLKQGSVELNVLPELPMADPSDCIRINAVAFGKSLDLAPTARGYANSSYIVFSQFGLPDCLSVGLTPFVNFIKIVIGTSAEKQVVRANTSRSITAMTHGETIRNRAIHLLIGKAMSAYRASLVSHCEQTMPKTSLATCPKPAIRGFLNLCPKGFCAVFTLRLMRAFSRAIEPNLSGLTLKFFATNHTGSFDLIRVLLSATAGRTKLLMWMLSLKEWLATGFADRHSMPRFCEMFMSLYHNLTGLSRQNLRGDRHGC